MEWYLRPDCIHTTNGAIDQCAKIKAANTRQSRNLAWPGSIRRGIVGDVSFLIIPLLDLQSANQLFLYPHFLARPFNLD